MRAIVLAVVLAGCPAFPQLPEYPEHLDAGPEAGSASADHTEIPQLCRLACNNLRRLGCAGRDGSPGYDEVFGTADDVPCAIVCADIEAAARNVPGLSLHPECLKAAKDCREASSCARLSSGQVPP